jgi:hypothetical protein
VETPPEPVEGVDRPVVLVTPIPGDAPIPGCPGCEFCPDPSGPADHEAWWWALCRRWGQCPNDPDAFWQLDAARLRRETALAKEDPEGYAT